MQTPLFPSLILYLLLQVLILRVEGVKFAVPSWKGIVTGVPFEVIWSGTTNTDSLTLSLDNGTTSNPNLVSNIASKITYSY